MPGKSIEFFKEINEAFTNGDMDFIEANATDDVQWTLTGSLPIHGKSELIKAMKKMQSERVTDLTFTYFITHGNIAAINGTMKLADKSGETKTYGFCHIYRLNKFKNGKIKEITSYVIEKDKHNNDHK